jgi:hypothetical protein
MDEPRSYRFGTLERNGFLGDMRPAQLVLLGACTALAFAGFLTLGAAQPVIAIGLALALAVVAILGAFVPVGGQPAADWAPVAARYLMRGRSRRSWRAPLVRRASVSGGVRMVGEERLTLPPELCHIELLAAPLRGGQIGVLAERESGTYTACLAVRVAAFALLDRADQERRLERWGTVLAGLAREGSPVSRVQWLERSLPADGDEVGRYLAQARDPTVPLSARTIASYLDLVDSAGTVTQDHELFLALQVSRARAGRAIKRHGGGDHGACAVLCRELELLAERLSSAQIGVRGALRPGPLCKALRIAYSPYERAALARLEAADPERDGVPVTGAGPLAASEHWSYYRSDGACHATFWIAGWPRIEVPAIWMMPVLTQSGVLRTVSLTMEPIPLARATREAEAARTHDLEQEQLRREHGFVTHARTRRRQEANVRRESELSRGHAELRFAGFVTVSARDPDALELACERTEHAATQSHLELRRLYGQQAAAFHFTLPLAEGLR